MAQLQTESSLSLKDELKAWEKQFAANNGGKKPSRSDIKADTNIAVKYKLYNDLRKPKETQDTVQEQATPSKKRVSKALLQATPQRRTAAPNESTHHGQRMEESEARLLDQENLSPSDKPTCSVIGPTPHKDGQVMGLFDYMPSATPRRDTRVVLNEVSLNVAQTPSRSRPTSIPLSASPAKLSRTPQSSGKRFMLDSFVTTPSKRLCLDADSPRQMQTPSFLHRCTQAKGDPIQDQSPQKVQPFKRRSFGRSLSSMIRDMKQQQEKALDEELDMLREIENGSSAPQPPRLADAVAETQLQDFEEDAIMALEELEQEERGEVGAEQPPPRVWKKKGQKRQTKRVIMRPVMRKPTTDVAFGAQHAVESGDEVEADGADSDEEASDYGASEQVALATKKTAVGAKLDAKRAPTAQKPARTINPNAVSHANFRSLKIKNKNSKGKGRGRFGRGR